MLEKIGISKFRRFTCPTYVVLTGARFRAHTFSGYPDTWTLRRGTKVETQSGKLDQSVPKVHSGRVHNVGIVDAKPSVSSRR